MTDTNAPLPATRMIHQHQWREMADRLMEDVQGVINQLAETLWAKNVAHVWRAQLLVCAEKLERVRRALARLYRQGDLVEYRQSKDGPWRRGVIVAEMVCPHWVVVPGDDPNKWPKGEKVMSTPERWIRPRQKGRTRARRKGRRK